MIITSDTIFDNQDKDSIVDWLNINLEAHDVYVDYQRVLSVSSIADGIQIELDEPTGPVLE